MTCIEINLRHRIKMKKIRLRIHSRFCFLLSAFAPFFSYFSNSCNVGAKTTASNRVKAAVNAFDENQYSQRYDDDDHHETTEEHIRTK